MMEQLISVTIYLVIGGGIIVVLAWMIQLAKKIPEITSSSMDISSF